MESDARPEAEPGPHGREAARPGVLARWLGRLPPIDAVVEEPEVLRAPPAPALAAQLAAALAERTGATGVLLRRSAGDALRVALRAAAAHLGRGEVVLPACASASRVAAARAAGLRIRPVDVDERGAIDPVALALLPLERAACVVVSSPFGLAHPVAPLAAIATPRGAWIVDDAIRSFGATASDGAAGSRGEIGVLGFGPGEPLQALGGGAVVWRAAALRAVHEMPVEPLARRAWLRARAWNAALGPLAFAALAPWSLPRWRERGPGARGPIGGDALVLCAHALARLDERQARREAEATALARDVRRETGFLPLLPAPGTRGAFPHLALRAPDRARREAAVRALARHGAGRPDPFPLAWAASPAGDRRPAPGARALADQVLTLPVHGGLCGARRERVLATLARLAPPEP